MLKMTRIKLLIFVSALLCVPFVNANMTDALRWGAFVSQGMAYSSDNHLYGDSDDGMSTELDEFGAWGSYAFNPSISFTGQVSMRDLGALENGSASVDYAFGSYLFLQNMDQVAGVRIGRIRSAFGLYNEIRDAPHTRSSIIMPQSIYNDRLRKTLFSSDGIEVYGSWQIDFNQLSYQFFYGESHIDNDEIDEISTVDIGGGLSDVDLATVGGDPEGDETFIARVIYEIDAGTWRFGLTYSRPKYHYEDKTGVAVIGGVSFPLKDGSIRRRAIISSIEYNHLDWSVSAEYIRDTRRTDGIFVGFDSGNSHGEGYYLQVIHRPNERLDIITRYDVSHQDRTDRSSPLNNTRDFTIGAGYRPKHNWLIRSELHLVQGMSWLSTVDNVGVNSHEHWNAFLLQVSYHW